MINKKIKELKNKKIAILGLGVNNEKLVDFLLKHKLKVTICDQDLNKKLLMPAYSANKSIKWILGEKYLDNLTNFDIVFRSPGIRFLHSKIQLAKQTGVEISSQTKLFLELCPAIVIGVTGTKGKGTTSTLIYEFLKASQKRVFLAGNIGQDPFDYLEILKKEDIVVLELSSFQLQDLDRSPHIAVVLNITSDHLDYHQDREEYLEAKKNITKFQSSDDYVVVNNDYLDVKNFEKISPSQNFYFSAKKKVSPGVYYKNNNIYLNFNNREQKICSKKEIKLLGDHNIENITAAVTASLLAGGSLLEIKKVIKNFSGLDYRMQYVQTIAGVKYYNDSLSTMPESTIAAINSFNEPIVLIIGGSDKGADFSLLVQEIIDNKIKAVILIGVVSEQIMKLFAEIGKSKVVNFKFDDEFKQIEKIFNSKRYKLPIITGCQSISQIVDTARHLAKKGEIVLFSPACASFDMFKNSKDRGRLFTEEVNRIKFDKLTANTNID